MINIRSYNVVKVMASVSLIVIAFEFLVSDLVAGIMMMPCVIVFLMANESWYKSAIRVFCRVTAGILISLISLGLIFTINDDPQGGIGLALGVVIQFAIIFVSEALIGLCTYEESSP